MSKRMDQMFGRNQASHFFFVPVACVMTYIIIAYIKFFLLQLLVWLFEQLRPKFFELILWNCSDFGFSFSHLNNAENLVSLFLFF